jgi:5-oxoprolinase (ATP-hydrolysing) subunit A
MSSIDLNCDLGESFGAFTIGNDEAIMDYVSSVNIACGFHAGDPAVMRKTISFASKKKLAIGAHPGLPDLQGFGRREMNISTSEIYEIVLYQIGALSAFAAAAGCKLYHVKPHGALYNMAVKDRSVSSAIVKAVSDFDKHLCFVGLSGSVMIEEAAAYGLRTVNEVFSDRTYQDDGSLTPRTSEGALIQDPARAAMQVLQMVNEKTVTTVSGKKIPVVAESICIHGDGKHALGFAQAIVTTLKANNVTIERF